jgi:hypothetical protein
MSGKGVALVTGASGGIGEEIAKQLAADGYSLVLVARDEERLHRVGRALAERHGITYHAVAADLTDPAAPERIFRETEARGVAVEVLVNNAGFGLRGTFVQTGAAAATDLSRELAMIQINCTAVTHLSKLYVPGMVARGRGRMLNVASTAAFQPGPLMAVYYATKAYVLSFSEALAVELQGTGVTVTCLCPGATRTEFQKAADMEQSRLFQAGHVMDAATVARVGLQAMHAGRATVVPGAVNKVMAVSTRFVPRTLAARLAKAAQENA